MGWAASTEGSKWLSEHVVVAALVKLEGNVLTSIWDALVKKFYEVTGITPPKPNAIQQATNATATGSTLPVMGAAEYSAAKDKWSKESGLGAPPKMDPLGSPYTLN